MAKMGRPTKLTQELIEELERYLKVGNYVETACAIVGIHKNTFYGWLKRANELDEALEKNPKLKLTKEDVLHLDFMGAVKKSQALAEHRDLTIIAKASESAWQASAWRLERRFPDRWGKKDKMWAEVEHSGQMHTTNEHTVSLVDLVKTDEESRELVKELWRRRNQVSSDELN